MALFFTRTSKLAVILAAAAAQPGEAWLRSCFGVNTTGSCSNGVSSEGDRHAGIDDPQGDNIRKTLAFKLNLSDYETSATAPKADGDTQEAMFAPTQDHYLTMHEQQIISVYHKVSPSVAEVHSFSTTSRPRTRWFGIQEKRAQVKQGTGFLWDKEGRIVTNHHVVYFDEPTKRKWRPKKGTRPHLPNLVLVTFQQDITGEPVEAMVIGGDEIYDIAVLKILGLNETALPKPVPLGNSSELQVGQSSLVIGNFLNSARTLTKGIVSKTNMKVELENKEGTTAEAAFLILDAVVRSGSSGSPLLDSRGRLIGMIKGAMAADAAEGAGLDYSGVAIAVGVDKLSSVVNEIIASGTTVPLL